MEYVKKKENIVIIRNKNSLAFMKKHVFYVLELIRSIFKFPSVRLSECPSMCFVCTHTALQY